HGAAQRKRAVTAVKRRGVAFAILWSAASSRAIKRRARAARSTAFSGAREARPLRGGPARRLAFARADRVRRPARALVARAHPRLVSARGARDLGELASRRRSPVVLADVGRGALLDEAGGARRLRRRRDAVRDARIRGAGALFRGIPRVHRARHGAR